LPRSRASGYDRKGSLRAVTAERVRRQRQGTDDDDAGVLPMTKSELIEEVARQVHGLSKRDIEIVVETIFETMTDALVRRDRIEIRGFGSFIAKKRRAREGRNPRRPEIKVSVPQKFVPFFTCGKELRERVNELTTSTTSGA
jgi:integration host factor subunit beta